MDLATLDTGADAATLHLKHPTTGQPLTTENGEPITISLVSADSERYRKAQRQIINERANSNSRKVDAGEIERSATRILIAAVASWQNIILDGDALECTPGNIARVFNRLQWVREQCDQFVNDRANFVKASAQN